MKILVLGNSQYLCADQGFLDNLRIDKKNDIFQAEDEYRNSIGDISNYPDRTFDMVIDANMNLIKFYNNRSFWEEINRILKLHGFFLGRKHSSYSTNSRLLSDKVSEEKMLQNKYGLYEEFHAANKNESYLSLKKNHKPRGE